MNIFLTVNSRISLAHFNEIFTISLDRSPWALRCLHFATSKASSNFPTIMPNSHWIASLAICIRDSSVSEAGGLAHRRRACSLTNVRDTTKLWLSKAQPFESSGQRKIKISKRFVWRFAWRHIEHAKLIKFNILCILKFEQTKILAKLLHFDGLICDCCDYSRFLF